MIPKFITAISAFYHIVATVAAMMAVFQFARILHGEENNHPLWRHIFNWVEAHLWISGVMLLAYGVLPFPFFLAGFVTTIALGTYCASRLLGPFSYARSAAVA